MVVVSESAIVRRRLRVRGQVQGVGFRPFVYRLANDLALGGHVLNDGGGVEIDIQGAPEQLDRFVERLRAEAPKLARIDTVDAANAPVGRVEGFEIEGSQTGLITTGIAPDAAICDDCLDDLFKPGGRRWRYAFTNCTNCGPRYTITAALPYDRPNTSMAGFVQCAACQSEYDDPRDRRFHAQPNACPACGPRLALAAPDGTSIDCADPLAETLRRLKAGDVVAIKGLGGFHLACDAGNADAVARLRQRKQREEKPFAVMAANVFSLSRFAQITAPERALLEGVDRPIVLLAKRPGCDDVLRGVAPGIATLGAMLPCTPLQMLLFHEAAGRPVGRDWLNAAQNLVLVMTSANPGGEPLVIDNVEAVRRLGSIADCLLVHDRDIVIRCDDSVVRASERGNAAYVRRARGSTPQAIRLSSDAPPVLAVGGHLKATICVTRGREAFVSQHIGSLDNAPTCVALKDAVAHLLDVLQIAPAAVAHDLHPDFYSTRFAAAFAAELGLPLTGVQHHHAHIAAVAAEHGCDERLLGVALDGVGLGSDGKLWGGELLLLDGAGSQRVGHLRELPLAGGDRAAREPWRVAAAVLELAGRSDDILRTFNEDAAPMVRQMLQQRVNSPTTTSMGRWFDAAAGLLHVRHRQSFEGQAPMLLEGLAAGYGPVAPMPGGYRIDDGLLDLLPLTAALAGEKNAARGAALFHATLVEALAHWVAAAAEVAAVKTVAFGGGCFLNAILSRGLREQLASAGLRVIEAVQVPPNDGGLSLGQAQVARLVALKGH